MMPRDQSHLAGRFGCAHTYWSDANGRFAQLLSDTHPPRSVTMSLASMGNVSLVVLLFFIIFAILGIQVSVGLHA